MATDVVSAGVGGGLTAPVAKQIRGQAMAIARDGTQDMQRQVKEELYEQVQLGGMVWMWSKRWTRCETCAPLDQAMGANRWPIHPNCLDALLIDPV